MSTENKIKHIIDWSKIKELYPQLSDEQIGYLKHHELESIKKRKAKEDAKNLILAEKLFNKSITHSSILVKLFDNKISPTVLAKFLFGQPKLSDQDKNLILKDIKKISETNLKHLINKYPEFILEIPEKDLQGRHIEQLIEQKNLLSLLLKSKNPPKHLVNIQYPVNYQNKSGTIIEALIMNGDWTTLTQWNTLIDKDKKSISQFGEVKPIDLLVVYAAKISQNDFLTYWNFLKPKEPSLNGLQIILSNIKNTKDSNYIGKVINLLAKDGLDFSKVNLNLWQLFEFSNPAKVLKILQSLKNSNYDLNKIYTHTTYSTTIPGGHRYYSHILQGILAHNFNDMIGKSNLIVWLIHKGVDIKSKQKSEYNFLNDLSSSKEAQLIKNINTLLQKKKIFPEDPNYIIRLYKDFPKEAQFWKKQNEALWFNTLQPFLGSKKLNATKNKTYMLLKVELEQYFLKKGLSDNKPQKLKLL